MLVGDVLKGQFSILYVYYGEGDPICGPIFENRIG
jgi:hypothetical protein